MTKIVCVSSTFPTALKYWRGAFVENFCRCLSEKRVDVSVVVPEGIPNLILEWLYLKLGWRKNRYATIHIRYAPYFSLTRFSFKYRLLNRLKSLSEENAVYRSLEKEQLKPDFIYAHFLACGFAASPWCQFNKVPLVVVSGESDYKYFYQTCDNSEVLKKTSRFAHLFFVSEDSAKNFADYFGAPPQCEWSILANAVDTQYFHPVEDKQILRRELDLPEDCRLVVFVGNFIERKGPLRLLNALQGMENTKGVFIGSGPQRLSGPYVAHSGPLENSLLPKWLAACDVFALPSLHEGRSNAILEAMACGLPLVVSDRSFNRDFLSDECAAFIDPMDPRSIADGISIVLNSGQRQQVMGRKARLYAEDCSLLNRTDKFMATLASIN